MTRLRDWLAALTQAEGETDLRAVLQRMVASFDHEAAGALLQHRRFDPPVEFRARILEAVARIPAERSRLVHAFLAEAGFEEDRGVKNLWIQAVRLRGLPALTHRLWTVFVHTEHEEKKRAILQAFAENGIDLFADEILAILTSATEGLRNAVLFWAQALPPFDARRAGILRDRLAQTAESLAPGQMPTLRRWALPVLIRHGLREKEVFRGKPRPSGVREEPSHLADLRRNLQVKVSRRPNVDDFFDLEQDGREAAFFPECREELLGRLSAFLARLEHESHLANFHPILARVHWLGIEGGRRILEALLSCRKSPPQEFLLNHLLSLEIPAESKETLRLWLRDRLVDPEHLRLPEAAARFLVTRMGREGLSLLAASIGERPDPEGRTALLKGCLQSLREDGFLRRLRAADLFHLQRIAASCEESLEREAGASDALWPMWCRFVGILRLELFEDALFRLSRRKAPCAPLLDALASLGTESSLRRFTEIFSDLLASTDPAFETEIRAGFSALARRVSVGRFPLRESQIRAALGHPSWSEGMIDCLARWKDDRFTDRIFPFLGSGSFGLRRAALDYLFQVGHADPEAVLSVLRKDPEPSLRRRAALIAGRFGDGPLVSEAIGVLLADPPAVTSVAEHFLQLRHDGAALEKNLQALLGFRHHPAFASLKSVWSELLRLRPPRDSEQILPLDRTLPP